MLVESSDSIKQTMYNVAVYVNAKVTIKRRGEQFDQDTGRKTTKAQETILSSVDCCFSQSRGSNRQRFEKSQRDVTNAKYSILIPQPPGTDLSGITIYPGDEATVVQTVGSNTITQVFSVIDAIPALGISEFHWEVSVERNKHAA